jgi:hypothetical protein
MTTTMKLWTVESMMADASAVMLLLQHGNDSIAW